MLWVELEWLFQLKFYVESISTKDIHIQGIVLLFLWLYLYCCSAGIGVLNAARKTMARMLGNNPQFHFLKPTHSMFTFFTSLADAYSKVLMPPKGLPEKLKKSVSDMTTVLERCVNRLEWERSQEQARQKAEDEIEQERIQREDTVNFSQVFGGRARKESALLFYEVLVCSICVLRFYSCLWKVWWLFFLWQTSIFIFCAEIWIMFSWLFYSSFSVDDILLL